MVERNVVVTTDEDPMGDIYIPVYELGHRIFVHPCVICPPPNRGESKGPLPRIGF